MLVAVVVVAAAPAAVVAVAVVAVVGSELSVPCRQAWGAGGVGETRGHAYVIAAGGPRIRCCCMHPGIYHNPARGYLRVFGPLSHIGNVC